MMKPAPPPPDPRAIAEALRRGSLTEFGPGPSKTTWKRTGGQEFRRGWFGRAVLFIEESRLVFRPIVTGYTPANWQQQTRWRRARMGDLG